jgi:hypothetical protein
MIKIGICGSRNFSEYSFFAEKLELLISNLEGEIEFLSGGCFSGADKLIKIYSEQNGYKLIEYLPDYIAYPNKSAPLKRNHTIVENSTHLIAFFDGSSKGTAYIIKLAEKKGIPTRIIKI